MIMARIRSAARSCRPSRFSLSGFRARFASVVFRTPASSMIRMLAHSGRAALLKVLAHVAEDAGISNKLHAVCKSLLRGPNGMTMIAPGDLSGEKHRANGHAG
jgi:hypothetical protein